MYARIGNYNPATHQVRAIENGRSANLNNAMTEYADKFDHLIIIPFSVGNQGQDPWTFQAYPEN
jgi:hypothetical protein